MAVKNVDCKDGDSIIITYLTLGYCYGRRNLQSRILPRSKRFVCQELNARRLSHDFSLLQFSPPPICLFLYPVRLVAVFSSKDTKSMPYPHP